MNPAFEFEQVSAGYDGVPVLQDIRLTAAEGEMIALLGPNGAGKSTLLRVLTGLLAPTAGRVRLFGREIGTIRAAERARLIAVVPQDLGTPMAFTVEELVRLGRNALLSPWERLTDADRQIVERAMVYTDVIELKQRTLETLSGGEKQRAVIAMALAQEPRLIVMDEPTTHLDLNHALEIMQIIERLNLDHGVTVLMTSHDINLAAEFCGRLLLLDRGRLTADGPPEAVLREEILRAVYRCELRVRKDEPTGSLFVAPAARTSLRAAAAGMAASKKIKVHVIAGGGSGGELLRRLCLGGYRISCGVLNQLDTDARSAEALGVALALEKPFSPIGADALERARAMVEAADAVVLTDVPFGPGNVVNLALAEEALRRGAAVLINDDQLERRDYSPGREAIARIGQLLQSGAVAWRQPNEALRQLAAISKPR